MQIKSGLEQEFKTAKEKNSDPYGACGYRYLQKWAELMEEKIVAGNKLKEIADKASHEADTEGITGFMYGCAVSTLAHFWVHGEELKKWHNKEHDYEGEGVVNPAILSISVNS